MDTLDMIVCTLPQAGGVPIGEGVQLWELLDNCYIITYLYNVFLFFRKVTMPPTALVLLLIGYVTFFLRQR